MSETKRYMILFGIIIILVYFILSGRCVSTEIPETSYQEVSVNVIQNNKVITSYIGALENKNNKIVILPLTKEGYIIVIEEIDAEKLFAPQPKKPIKSIKEKPKTK